MWKNYLKIAWKVLLRRKFFTFISLFAIGFTLAVLLTAATLLDHFFGPHPPDIRSDRTLGIFWAQMKGPRMTWNSGSIGYGFLDRYCRDIPGVEVFSICTASPRPSDSFINGRKVKSDVRRTDGAFWQIMAFQFLEGRPYTDEDDRQASMVAVINQRTRALFFGGQPALGQFLTVDGQRFRVVGVVPDVSRLRLMACGDIWVPIGTAKSQGFRKELMGEYHGYFLAGSPASFPRIQAEFDSRLKRVEFPDPQNFNQLDCGLQTISEAVASRQGMGKTGGTIGLVAIIMILMVLFMFLPAVNLVNLNISRILERCSEIGVRKAFGAASRTLIGQFVVENILLTLIGSLLGILGAVLILFIIAETGLIPYADFQINPRILLYGLTLTLFFGLFSGIYPAWRMSRLQPVQAIKGGLS